jgi:fructose-1,6-bisphosphatase/inositol monophosphatase family enzyme
MNLVTRECFDASRGGGAWCDGQPITPSARTAIADAIIGLSGFPGSYLGWSQYRAFGAAALDLCLVAAGRLDGYIDCSQNAHGVWDYAGAMLVCREAGAPIEDADGRELLVLDPEARRTPVAAATPELLAELLEKRARISRPAR